MLSLETFELHARAYRIRFWARQTQAVDILLLWMGDVGSVTPCWEYLTCVNGLSRVGKDLVHEGVGGLSKLSNCSKSNI